MGRKIRKPKVNYWFQVWAMREIFPHFTYDRMGKWTGTLSPFDDASEYVVNVQYRPHTIPKVYVLEPEIVENAPHRYADNSLCLYYPEDRSWTSKLLIAKTILPWTAEWLAFYEIWLSTGIWYGEEAPHTNDKG